MTREPLNLDSVAVHAGREDLQMLGVHALPIDLSTTNPLPDIEHGGDSYESMALGGHPLADGGSVYARLWNPTVARFEAGLAQLEKAEAAVAFASGMAAMTAAILASKDTMKKGSSGSPTLLQCALCTVGPITCWPRACSVWKLLFVVRMRLLRPSRRILSLSCSSHLATRLLTLLTSGTLWPRQGAFRCW